MHPPLDPAPEFVEAPGPRSKLGIVALILGIVALVLSCVPLLGFLLALAGVIVGIIAVIDANRSQRGRKAASTIGLVLSGVAICASVVLPLMLGMLLPALAAARGAARDAKAEMTIHGTDPEAAAMWTDHDQPCTVGGVTVTILEIEATDEWIAFTLEIKNTGTRRVECESLRGDLESGSSMRKARLTSDARDRLTIVDTDYDSVPEGFIPQDEVWELDPGDTAGDTVTFNAPAGRVKFVDLDLPGRSVGQEENFRFRIPASAWNKKSP